MPFTVSKTHHLLMMKNNCRFIWYACAHYIIFVLSKARKPKSISKSMSKKHDPTEEAHNHADTVAAILKGETPEWSDLKLEFERMKYDHRLKDADIALIFGYKDAGSFRRSRAHRERVREIVWFWLKTQ